MHLKNKRQNLTSAVVCGLTGKYLSRRCDNFEIDKAVRCAPLGDTYKLKSGYKCFSCIIKDNLGSFHFCLCYIVVTNAVVKHTEIIVGNLHLSFY